MGWAFRETHLSLSAQAAITEYPSQGGVKHRDVFPHSSRVWKPEVKVLDALVSLDASPWLIDGAALTVSSRGVPSCVHMSNCLHSQGSECIHHPQKLPLSPRILSLPNCHPGVADFFCSWLVFFFLRFFFNMNRITQYLLFIVMCGCVWFPLISILLRDSLIV